MGVCDPITDNIVDFVEKGDFIEESLKNGAY